jgi:hypothetical protein
MTLSNPTPDLFSSELLAVRKLLLAQAEIRAILAMDMPWKDKYDLIFADRRSGVVYSAFAQLNLSFEWPDPDLDYEDDARAFAHALDERMTQIGPLAALCHSATA